MYLAMNKWHPSHLCCPVCGCSHIFSLDEDGSAWICDECFTSWLWKDVEGEF
jgi:hypothetical protein